MNKIDDMRSCYEKIKASEELKDTVKKSIDSEKKKGNIFRKCIGIAASFTVASVMILNVSPSIAYASADIPILGNIVKVITFGRYQAKDNGYEANIVIPEIQGLLDKDTEKRLNDELKENADLVIKAFEDDLKLLKEEFGDETVHMGVEYNYIVKTDNSDILSLDVYLLNIVGSSSTIHKFYTIDKNTGEVLTLNGLFKEDSDYVSVLSNYIKKEMERMNKEEGGMFWVGSDSEIGEGFEKIKADQNFYIDKDGMLVICFDKYEVAAGAQGSPEFVIPKDVIENIIK